MKTLPPLLLATIALILRAQADITVAWQPLPCCANDISVGADGTVWIIEHVNSGNGDLFRWNGTTWIKQEGLHGTALAVDPQGQPWIVNHSGDIYRPSNGTWVQVDGKATDVGVGADGSVWITGYKRSADLMLDADVFKWDGVTWIKEPNVQGVRIAVDPSGEPTLIDATGDIFRRQNGGWSTVSGYQGGDAGIGADGSFWITGTRPDALDHEVYLWNDGNLAFDKVAIGEGTRISVAPNGEPWLVNAGGDIFVGHSAVSPPSAPIIDLASFTVGAAGVSVSVTTITGATYFLEAKDIVEAAEWQSVDHTPGTGGLVTLHDGRAPGTAGFYQIRVTQP